VHDINCFPTGQVEGRGLSRSDVREPWARGAPAASPAVQQKDLKQGEEVRGSASVPIFPTCLWATSYHAFSFTQHLVYWPEMSRGVDD